MKFDPMTGEPIEEAAQEVTPKTVTKFDPMTGEPVEVVVDETTNAQSAQTAQAGQTKDVKQKVHGFVQKLLAKPAALAVAGGVVVAVIVVVLIASGVFTSNRNRVFKAIANTVSDQGALGDAFLEVSEVYASNDKHTTALTVEYSGVEVSGEYRHTPTDKQVWAFVDGGSEDLEGTLTLTEGQALATTPLVEDTLFVYDYTKVGDGYLMEEFTSSEIELFNECLETLYNGVDSDEMKLSKETQKAIKEWYKDIEVEKEDEKEEFEINGKDKKCTGYTMEITEDTVCDLIEIMGDVMDESGALDDMDMDADDFVKEMQSAFSGMPDVELTFYLDSNKLAAVIVEVEGEEVEILFEGGEYRMQNVKVKYDGTTVVKVKGETDGKVETVELTVSGQKFFEYEYDAKSGNFEAAVFDYYGDEVVTVEATITAKKGSVSIEDGNVEVEGESVDFEFSAKKGATIEKLEGEEFDVGEASYSDWEDIADEINDALY